MSRAPAAIIVRAKVVLAAIALAATVTLFAIGSWPLRVLVILAFIRGLFARDLVALRSAARTHWIRSRAAIPFPLVTQDAIGAA